MSFKEIVYKSPGRHFAHNGKTYDYKAVNSHDELRDALADGWFESLVEAVDGKPSQSSKFDDLPPTRAELEKKCDELGIKYNGRMKDDTLSQKIDEALA